MENILKKIINKKKDNLISSKKKFPINTLLSEIKELSNYNNFTDKIKKRSLEKKISIIAEIKEASPSAGKLVKNFNHLEIAKNYVENGAACLSVLTEENFFLGKYDYIKAIKNIHSIPILCKDFFIDPYQIALAKYFSADCILIILSAVDKALAKDLYQAAIDLNMSTLVEVHTEKEAEFALNFNESLIGINNRNLKTLNTSLNTSVILSKILNNHKNPLVCESGIHSAEEANFIIKETKIYNFLIGESLLASDDIGAKLKQFTQINL